MGKVTMVTYRLKYNVSYAHFFSDLIINSSQRPTVLLNLVTKY